jgi:hypothetical protein
MYGDSGFDRFLEWQYHFTGDFYTLLFRTIGQADDQNLERLAKGFPEEVEAHVIWTTQGIAPFVEHVTKGHPLLLQVLHEHGDSFVISMALADKLPKGYKIDQGDQIDFPAPPSAPPSGPAPDPPRTSQADEGDSDYDGGGPAGPGRSDE